MKSRKLSTRDWWKSTAKCEPIRPILLALWVCSDNSWSMKKSKECIEVRHHHHHKKSHAVHGTLSVTCYLVNFPPLPQPKLVLDLTIQEGCKAELTWVTSPREFTHQIRSILEISYNPALSRLGVELMTPSCDYGFLSTRPRATNLLTLCTTIESLEYDTCMTAASSKKYEILFPQLSVPVTLPIPSAISSRLTETL